MRGNYRDIPFPVRGQGGERGRGGGGDGGERGGGGEIEAMKWREKCDQYFSSNRFTIITHDDQTNER